MRCYGNYSNLSLSCPFREEKNEFLLIHVMKFWSHLQHVLRLWDSRFIETRKTKWESVCVCSLCLWIETPPEAQERSPPVLWNMCMERYRNKMSTATNQWGGWAAQCAAGMYEPPHVHSTTGLHQQGLLWWFKLKWRNNKWKPFFKPQSRFYSKLRLNLILFHRLFKMRSSINLNFYSLTAFLRWMRVSEQGSGSDSTRLNFSPDLGSGRKLFCSWTGRSDRLSNFGPNVCQF